MSLTKNYTIAAVILSQVLSQAVTISTNLQTENQLVNMSAYTYMVPFHTEANTKIGATRMEINHRFPLKSFGSNIQGLYKYSELFSLYGKLGASVSLDDEVLFSQASLLIKPKLSPQVAVGALYETQSGSTIEVGANYTYMPFNLTTKSNGGLFHGYPETINSDLKANLVDINIGVTVPYANKFSAFLNLHYGIDIIETALETNTVVSQNQRSAMLEHDGNTTLELGHMFDRGLKFSGTKLSIGTRFNITEIYN